MPSAQQAVTKYSETLNVPRAVIDRIARDLLNHDALPKSRGSAVAEMEPYHLALLLIACATTDRPSNSAKCAALFGGLETIGEDEPVTLAHYLAHKIARYRDGDPVSMARLKHCQLSISLQREVAIWSEPAGDDIVQLAFSSGRVIPSVLSHTVTVPGEILVAFGQFARSNVYELVQ